MLPQQPPMGANPSFRDAIVPSTSTGAKAMGGSTGNIIPKGYQYGQMQQFTPEQMQLFSRLFGQVGPQSFTGRLAGGDEALFQQMEAPAMRQFAGLMGGLGSRFSGMGMGARRSSGFQQAGSQAAADFAERLQSQRLGLQQQAIRDLMGMSTELLGQRPYQQFVTEKPRSFWEQLGLGLTQAGAQAAGQALPLAFML
jgi:hypothetical protein